MHRYHHTVHPQEAIKQRRKLEQQSNVDAKKSKQSKRNGIPAVSCMRLVVPVSTVRLCDDVVRFGEDVEEVKKGSGDRRADRDAGDSSDSDSEDAGMESDTMEHPDPDSYLGTFESGPCAHGNGCFDAAPVGC